MKFRVLGSPVNLGSVGRVSAARGLESLGVEGLRSLGV